MEFVELPGKYSCYLCGAVGKQYASKFPGRGPSPRWAGSLVTWCASCGSGIVRDAKTLVEGYYTHDYAAMRGDRNLPPARYFSEENDRLPYYMRRVNHQVSILKSVGAKFGKVLDFGSGPGYFLYGAKPDKSFAVELDDESAKYLRFLGAKRLSQSTLPRDFFDIVVASHAIEHVLPEELKSTIDQIWNSIKPGGIFFAEVPMGSRMQFLMKGEKAPHTLFFSPEGFRHSLMREGCTILAAGARGVTEYKLLDSPRYRADESDEFASVKANGLYMAIRKGQSHTIRISPLEKMKNALLARGVHLGKR